MLLSLCLAAICGGVVGQFPPPLTPPSSPCPDVFRYRLIEGQWTGHVEVPYTRQRVSLLVSLFITADLTEQLPGGLHLAEDNGMDRPNTVSYVVIFPIQSPLPLLDSITVNGVVICDGKQVASKTLSTANFGHKLDVPSLNGKKHGMSGQSQSYIIWQSSATTMGPDKATSMSGLEIRNNPNSAVEMVKETATSMSRREFRNIRDCDVEMVKETATSMSELEKRNNPNSDVEMVKETATSMSELEKRINPNSDVEMVKETATEGNRRVGSIESRQMFREAMVRGDRLEDDISNSVLVPEGRVQPPVQMTEGEGKDDISNEVIPPPVTQPILKVTNVQGQGSTLLIPEGTVLPPDQKTQGEGKENISNEVIPSPVTQPTQKMTTLQGQGSTLRIPEGTVPTVQGRGSRRRKPEVVDDLRHVQLLPRRILVYPDETVTLLARTGKPIRVCTFKLPDQYHKRAVFSINNPMPSNDEYEYFGEGLEKGDCGIRLKYVDDSMDGVVECKITPVGLRGMSKSFASIVRVTEWLEEDLPPIKISPNETRLSVGEEVTITCNTNPPLPLGMCSFTLPTGIELNLDHGENSKATREYRYHGTGLQNGQCGVTLTALSRQALTGYITCKVGELSGYPEGLWNADFMKITTTGSLGLVSRFGGFGSTLTVAPKKGSCGVPVQQKPLILGGMATARGEWPWLVALYLEQDMEFICGSTLINVKHVLTAAHCIKTQSKGVQYDKSELVLVLGKYNISKWSEGGLQPRKIERISIHPQYNYENLRADIAVLVLDKAAEYNQFVQPICLWKFDPVLEHVVNKTAAVVGWGRSETNYYNEIPLIATVPIVSQETCVSSNNGFTNFITDRTLCGGYRNGTGPCSGDSGSGLYIGFDQNGVTRWYLRGIVSLSLSGNRWICGLNEFTVYTDVAQYSSWLQQFMASD